MSKIILKKLKELNTIWHPESTLVFKSKDEQVVIGRWNNSSFIELDQVALELCDTWKFKVDDSLIEQEEVEEVSDNAEAMDTDEVVIDEVEEQVVEEQVKNVVEKNIEKEELVFPKCFTNFVNLSDAVHNSIDSVFVKLNELANELSKTKEKLESRDKEYFMLEQEFNSIQNKFAKLKTLLS
jgi:hypothetical protein